MLIARFTVVERWNAGMMNFIRISPKLFSINSLISGSNFKFKTINFSTCMPFSVKYGKLINDHVTNAFYLPINLEEDGSEMAIVLYEKQKGLLNLHHTEVPEHLQGKGIGHVLAKEVFDYCSARNLKVLLSCEFLQTFYEENPKYKNLVHVCKNMNL